MNKQELIKVDKRNETEIASSNNFSYYSSKEIKKSNYFSKKIKIFESYYSVFDENKEKKFETINKELGIENSKESLYLFTRAELFNDFSKNLFESKIMKAYNEKRPFIIFLMLPFISLGFLLIFRKKELNYIDHLVFVYSIATVLFIKYFFDFIILVCFNFNISFITFAFFLVYIHKALRKFYDTKRWKTIFKFVTLTIVSLLIGLPVIIISILIVLLTTAW